MEYDRELVEKIWDEFEAESVMHSSTYDVIRCLRPILESFLEPELPVCPVCGGEMGIGGANPFYPYCTKNKCTCWHEDYPTRQEAIEAFWNTPYGRLCRDDAKASGKMCKERT